MLVLMLTMTVLGLALLVGGAALTRRRPRAGADPVATARLLQAIGIALLAGALLVRPADSRASAFPPPPDAPARPGR